MKANDKYPTEIQINCVHCACFPQLSGVCVCFQFTLGANKKKKRLLLLSRTVGMLSVWYLCRKISSVIIFSEYMKVFEHLLCQMYHTV